MLHKPPKKKITRKLPSYPRNLIASLNCKKYERVFNYKRPALVSVTVDAELVMNQKGFKRCLEKEKKKNNHQAKMPKRVVLMVLPSYFMILADCS